MLGVAGIATVGIIWFVDGSSSIVERGVHTFGFVFGN